jgi:gliding motility-associated-like protein
LLKRGRGAVVTGGGGGHGKYGGGGGGGNYGSGGKGGKMTTLGCSDPNEIGCGLSDHITSNYFAGSGDIYRDRIYMGGGGGSGTGQASNGTNGGNGGGIVFVIARTLLTNNKKISANGADVNTVAINYASAGGGGAGGSVLLAVDEFIGPLNVSARGGKGGNTFDYCSGHGGGGGGGFVWVSLPTLNFNLLNLAGGISGATTVLPFCLVSASSGNAGDSANRLNPVLNGFLFNLIGKTQKICYGETPLLLKGSMPKGGDGKYRYQWQKRLRTTNWESIPGSNTKDFQPSALYDTTYFRRVVKVFQPQWNDSVVDTSKFIIINVIPEIKSNIISPDTAICYGLPKVLIQGENATGGDGTLTYLWESRTESAAWAPAAGVNTGQNYANTSNTETGYYRRKVFSNICTHISNVDTITVYPLISNNTISDPHTICYNYNANQLLGSNPGGGSLAYNYKWEKSTNDSSSWFDGGGTAINHNPGKLTLKTYYRRLVFSGLNNTCKDTSSWIRIDITPAITNNIIQLAQTICEGSAPSMFTGSNPANGNGLYKYQWEKSLDKISWDSISTSNLLKDYTSTSLIDTTYFRRIVRSGILDCCKDTSTDIKITVQPRIQNNIVSSHQEICTGQTPALLKQESGSVFGGNGTSYNYTWEQKTDVSSIWSNASGPFNQLNYQSQALTLTTYFRRKVESGTCTHYSDSLKVNVLPLITQNTISGNNEVCRDLQPGILTGSIVSGGTNDINEFRYQWQDSISGGAWGNITTEGNTIHYQPYIIPVRTFFRRVVNSGINDCCTSKSAPHELRINELPVATLTALDTSICYGNSLDLKVNISGNSPFTVVLYDSSSNLYSRSLLSTGLNKLNIEPIGSPPIQVSEYIPIQIDSVRDSKGCYATNKTGLARVRVIQVPIANPGTLDSICGLVYKLQAIASIGTGEWKTTEQASFSPSKNDPGAEVTFIEYGKHSILWTEIHEMCMDSSEVEITFFEQPVKPVLGNDTILQYQFNFMLEAIEPDVGKGKWFSETDSLNIQAPNNTTTLVDNLIFGKHQFVWKVTNGSCIPVSDTIYVEVDDIKRYNGFSPNGDGHNDIFVMEGLDNAVSGEIVIMNRWGSIVYSNNNYKNNWNGTNNNGNPLPDDTYYYILTVDGNRNYKGFIVLKR